MQRKAGYRRKRERAREKGENICHDLLSESHHHLCKEMERIKLNIHEKEKKEEMSGVLWGKKLCEKYTQWIMKQEICLCYACMEGMYGGDSKEAGKRKGCEVDFL
jgi:hypothetical protein